MNNSPKSRMPDESRRSLERRRRGKNIAIAAGIAVLIAMFYFVTIVKLQNLPAHIEAP